MTISCKKFVQVNPPTTQLVTSSVFNNDASATAAQVAIYSTMVSHMESMNLEVQTGLLSDELRTYNLGSSALQFYKDAMLAANNPGPWQNAYNYIYQANAIIEAVQGNYKLSGAVVRQLLGEAKFIRAFWHFYLVDLYGDVPLVTTTNYSVNQAISRTNKSAVYQQVIADLKDAKNLMNPNYINSSDTVVTTADRTRPNKWSASALLARVYLYTDDYVDAETEADSLLDGNPLYSLTPNLAGVFKVHSNEAIWQLGIPQPSNYNTPEGEYFILTSAPGGGTLNCCAISSQLLSSFELGDNRRSTWIDSFTTTKSPITTYYFPYKYTVHSGTTVTEDIVVFRLAEQYLIRAEARANQGNLSGATVDLNTIRNRAGLANIADSISSSKSTLLSAIMHERKVELFTEWGHRWFDLGRTKSADSVMSVVAPLKGGSWSTDEHQLLYPIPTIDLGLDVNLTQNPGYGN